MELCIIMRFLWLLLLWVFSYLIRAAMMWIENSIKIIDTKLFRLNGEVCWVYSFVITPENSNTDRLSYSWLDYAPDYTHEIPVFISLSCQTELYCLSNLFVSLCFVFSLSFFLLFHFLLFVSPMFLQWLYNQSHCRSCCCYTTIFPLTIKDATPALNVSTIVSTHANSCSLTV